MDGAGTRTHSTRDTDQSHSRRLLRPAGIDSFQVAATGAGFCAAGFSAAVSWHRTHRKNVPALLRLRSRALAGWSLVGDFRSHSNSHGRWLRIGEPTDHVTHFS